MQSEIEEELVLNFLTPQPDPLPSILIQGQNMNEGLLSKGSQALLVLASEVLVWATLLRRNTTTDCLYNDTYGY